MIYINLIWCFLSITSLWIIDHCFRLEWIYYSQVSSLLLNITHIVFLHKSLKILWAFLVVIINKLFKEKNIGEIKFLFTNVVTKRSWKREEMWHCITAGAHGRLSRYQNSFVYFNMGTFCDFFLEQLFVSFQGLAISIWLKPAKKMRTCSQYCDTFLPSISNVARNNFLSTLWFTLYSICTFKNYTNRQLADVTLQLYTILVC